MSNNKQSEQIARLLSGYLGKSTEELAENMQKGDVNGALSNLNDDQRQKVQSILSNPELTKKLMEDKKVQEILRRIGSDG